MFITKWDAFVFMVMHFGLCNVIATFQCAIMDDAPPSSLMDSKVSPNWR